MISAAEFRRKKQKTNFQILVYEDQLMNRTSTANRSGRRAEPDSLQAMRSNLRLPSRPVICGSFFRSRA